MKRLSFILLIVITSVSARGQEVAQTDSIRTVQFQYIKHPNRIHHLKVKKRIALNVLSVDSSYSFIRGRVTAITDSDFVINNKFHIDFANDSIKDYKLTIVDYRFNVHLFPRILLASVGCFIAGTGIFISIIGFALGSPDLAIASVFLFGPQGAFFIALATSRTQHKIDKWNVSVKKKISD